MNIAIVGSGGYIAQFLIERLKKNNNIVRIGRTKNFDYDVDLSNPESFDYSVLNDIDFLVFTAAISSPDKCATEYDGCWKINVDGTIYFIREAMCRKCRVLFFSSDAVYGKDKGCAFTEQSTTNADTPYGKMKKAVEDEFRDRKDFKSIRLSYVFSSKDKFTAYCMNCIQNKEVAEIYHPFYRNVTWISDVVEVVDWLICHWDGFEPQAINVAGEELISRIRIADEINRCFEKKLIYTIKKPEPSYFKNRPEITQMTSLYLSQIIEQKPFSEMVKREFEEMNK